jgi:glycosidase
MSKNTAYLSQNDKEIAINKLKMAAVLQFTLPGVPCIYYGDENGMEGHIDPFCRQCFDWEHLNEDLLSFYRKLGKIRKDRTELFKDGEFEEILVKDGLFFFKRKKENTEIFICVNNSKERKLFEINETYLNCFDNKIYQNYISIDSYSFLIFEKTT